jgi:hypothetical protein
MVAARLARAVGRSTSAAGIGRDGCGRANVGPGVENRSAALGCAAKRKPWFCRRAWFACTVNSGGRYCGRVALLYGAGELLPRISLRQPTRVLAPPRARKGAEDPDATRREREYA